MKRKCWTMKIILFVSFSYCESLVSPCQAVSRGRTLVLSRIPTSYILPRSLNTPTGGFSLACHIDAVSSWMFLNAWIALMVWIPRFVSPPDVPASSHWIRSDTKSHENCIFKKYENSLMWSMWWMWIGLDHHASSCTWSFCEHCLNSYITDPHSLTSGHRTHGFFWIREVVFDSMCLRCSFCD